MRFIVCSDNHGKKEVLQQILDAYPEARAFIHCGDNELSPEEMKGYHAVTGNNDYYHKYPLKLVVDIEGLRVLFTHGHTLSYQNRVKALSSLAKESQCQMACYGHTHIFTETMEAGILCLNPGSLSYNRDGSEPCYAVVDYEAGVFKVTRKLVRDL